MVKLAATIISLGVVLLSAFIVYGIIAGIVWTLQEMCNL